MQPTTQISIAEWNEAVARDAQETALAALEDGQVLFFPQLAFKLTDAEARFLTPDLVGDSKNVSYQFGARKIGHCACAEADKPAVAGMMHRFCGQAKVLVENLLPAYQPKLTMGRASLRPVEAAGRAQSWRKDDTRLHVDSFPATPLNGKRILRVFTNVNPAKDRVWIVAERFPRLAARYARDAGLPKYADGSAWSGLKRALSRVGLPVADRAPYDEFMLHFHDWLKENSEFQTATTGKEQISFPPLATWLVYTDGVPHAALSGQFAMEQTFIVPVDALVTPEVSPLRVLEKLAGRSMS